MTSQEWQRIKQVMSEALDQPDTKTRQEFLSSACQGDRALQQQIDDLLTHASDRMDVAADKLAGVAMDDAAVRIGERLGDYEIIREIGRGGMGAIYLGRRADEQFEKEVAVKVLKRGTDTDEVLRRFRAERQILARLEHPNIARLLDAGTTEDGLPYFVMEYVAGERITDYCAVRELAVRDRVELFVKVCGAVQFAHRNLIVHRDLKPGNILVTGNGDPKLLDFGIAKLLTSDNEIGALTMTLPEQQRLTPYYASPEQVCGEPVTTSSDVYSLGALLFEVLTGKPPHHFATAQPSPTDLVRVIAEKEMPRASATVESAEVQRELRGDLDNILLTALRKEPERRYSGVSAFADDLRRFLEHRPVRARPATFGYRASRFITRNKVGVGATALVCIALIGGAIANVVEARRTAYHAQREAAHFRDLRKLANLFIFKYHDGIAALPGSTELRKQLVHDALDYLNNLVAKGSDDPGLLREVATAYRRIADVQGGVLTNMSGGGTVSASNLGDTAGALENYNKARMIRAQLVRLQPGNSDLRLEQAEVEGNLGEMDIILGRPAEGAAQFRNAIAFLQTLRPERPNDQRLLSELRSDYWALGNVLAIATSNLGDIPGGLEAMRNGVSLGEALVSRDPTNPRLRQALATGYGDTGRILFNDGDAAAALEYYRKALAMGQALAAENPQTPLYQRELAVQHRNVGGALLETGEKGEALTHFRDAVALFEKLIAADPRDARLRRSAAFGYRDLAEALAANGNAVDAEPNFATALRIFEELAAQDAKNTILVMQQALTHLKISRFFAPKDQLRATASAERSVALSEAGVSANADDVSGRKTLAEAYAQLGYCHTLSAPTGGDPRSGWQQARTFFEKSAVIWRELEQRHKLTSREHGKPAEIAAALARCDSAVAELRER